MRSVFLLFFFVFAEKSCLLGRRGGLRKSYFVLVKGCKILGEIMCFFVRGNLMLRGCLQKAKREVMWKIRLTIMWQ